MAERGIASLIVCMSTLAAAAPASAMPALPMAIGSIQQRVSLHEPSARVLVIRRTVTMLAVEPEWTQGWGVPIVGSVRILPATLARW